MAYKQKRAKMLSVRASEEEWERVKSFCQRVIRHHPYMTEADVLRELIGLIDTGLITPRMRLELLDPEYSVGQVGAHSPAEAEMIERVRRDAEATLAVERAQAKQEEEKRKSSRRKKPAA